MSPPCLVNIVNKRQQILIRRFFSRIRGKNILVFTFFLCLSAAFWLFVVLDEVYEKPFNINLKLKGVPENVVVTTDLPPTLQVVLKDKGSQLLTYRYAGLPSINVDFKNYDQHSGHVVISTGKIIKNITDKLPNTTQLVSFSQNRLEYFYNYGTHVRMPVTLVSSITTERLYGISNIHVTPDSVTVYALTEILDTLTSIPTVPLQLTEINESQEITLPLTSIKGVKTEPSQVKVNIKVDQMTEKTVSVPIHWINFPATKTLRTFPSNAKVVFQVGMSRYRKITANDFALVVSYEELLDKTDGRIHLALKSIPDGVSHVRIIPNDVDFLIEDVPETTNY